MMNDDEMHSCVRTTFREEQMKLIRNLIEVKINDEQLQKADFKDGIQVQIRSEKPFTVNAFWIVKIHDLHKEIEKDWRQMRDELWADRFLTEGANRSMYQTRQQIHHQTHDPVECDLKPPCEIDTSNMTTRPRDFYPLVIIVTCHEEEPSPQATDAAANIHIVHIKDSIVPIRSHVIKQYIKQFDGRILDVSQLYLEETSACIICFEEPDAETGLKLFCLLPCRHSPICSNCIKRIHECPKCRHPIASVFDINAPRADEQVAATSSGNQSGRGTIDPNLRHLYNDDNEGQRSDQRKSNGFFSSLKSMFGF